MKPSQLFIILLVLLFADARSQPTNTNLSSPVKEVARKKLVTLVQEGDSKIVSLRSHIEQQAHFYLFDLEGTMVYQAVLKKGDHKQIKEIPEGTYTYFVFVQDVSKEEGKITVK